MNKKETKLVANLKTYAGGNLLEELADEQKKVVAAVRETGKAGKITIVLDMKRNGPHDVLIKAKVTPVIPKFALEDTILYADDENDMHEGNPDQLKLADNVSSIDKSSKVSEI